MKFLSLLLFVPGLIACKTTAQSDLKLVDSGFIFLKAEFESCHASTICELPGDRLMAAWFGGRHEGSSDVAIWHSVLENGNWSKPVEIANGVQPDGSRYPCWNPVLFRTAKGTLFLHYKVGPSPSEWWAELKISHDDGKTWSTSKRLPPNFLGPIKNKPVQLTSGEILYPSSLETPDGKWTIHFEKSDSIGNNWKMISVDCGSYHAIQPTILVHGSGKLQVLCRSKEGVIVESWSVNNGDAWEKVQSTELPNPGSGIDAVTSMYGEHFLVYNPTKRGRNKLMLAGSANGKDWKDIQVLEDSTQGEYSYPAIIQGKDGSIFITYTYNRNKIKYLKFRYNYRQ